MTVQDIPDVGALATPAVSAAATSARLPQPARRLPVHKDWPAWAILTTQIGILLGAIALWEVAATYGWIDAFFWSKPSAIYATLIKFFAAGDAWTDIGFTF